MIRRHVAATQAAGRVGRRRRSLRDRRTAPAEPGVRARCVAGDDSHRRAHRATPTHTGRALFTRTVLDGRVACRVSIGARTTDLRSRAGRLGAAAGAGRLIGHVACRGTRWHPLLGPLESATRPRASAQGAHHAISSRSARRGHECPDRRIAGFGRSSRTIRRTPPSATGRTCSDELFGVSLRQFVATSATGDRWFDWTSDGCSAPLVGNTGLSFNFRDPCRRHDFGYRNLSAARTPLRHVARRSGTRTNRRRVDRQFLADMKCALRHPAACSCDRRASRGRRRSTPRSAWPAGRDRDA